MRPTEPSTRDSSSMTMRVFDVAESRAAVFFRENHAQQAQFGRAWGSVPQGNLRRFVPLHDMRGDLRFGEFADGAAELLLFVGQGKIHARLGALFRGADLVSHGSMRSARREGEKVNDMRDAPEKAQRDCSPAWRDIPQRDVGKRPRHCAQNDTFAASPVDAT